MFVEIQLRITFVTGDHKIKTVRQFDQITQSGGTENGADIYLLTIAYNSEMGTDLRSNNYTAMDKTIQLAGRGGEEVADVVERHHHHDRAAEQVDDLGVFDAAVLMLHAKRHKEAATALHQVLRLGLGAIATIYLLRGIGVFPQAAVLIAEPDGSGSRQPKLDLAHIP